MINKRKSILSVFIALFLCSMTNLNAQRKHICNHNHCAPNLGFSSNCDQARKMPKLKVFILAGQSNSEGNGEVGPETTAGTLSNFIQNNGSQEFSHLRTAEGEWAPRNDVWVRFDHEQRGLLANDLNVGYGWNENQIGPELGFGHQLGEYEVDQVLIIKTCWGGKSLKEDFRPPSSGGTTGAYYLQMMADISAAIDNIQTEFPQYQNEQIELAGFVWFQGWNDGEEASYFNEYEQNLTNLILDVRSELNQPELPVVVALTGNGGRMLEPEGTWVHNLQTKIVSAQINAVESNGLEKVAVAETRDFWRAGNLSPEPDFLHHWNNNAESYLRIGHEMGLEMIGLLEGNSTTGGSNSMGYVQPNTNMALPSAYNLQEYVFGEPDDQGDCLGNQNGTAVIDEVFLSQTHRHEIGHPLFFTIGERPALLQLAVTGSGAAPDVQVEGILNGNNLGTLCLKGPAMLSANINLAQPNFEDYFSVTLPKAWIKEGLELRVSAGNSMRTLTQDDLKISPFTEVNLVMVRMDAMDYNTEPYNISMFDNFLEEVASAIPASVVRFGEFPETLRLPSFAFSSWQDEIVVTSTDEEVGESPANTGNLNYYMNELIRDVQRSTGDYPNTIYFGNTLNLQPGGWGGDGTFVSFDFTDNFIHELGHALGCPHWGEFYRIPNPAANEPSYPYKGEEGEASGRGTAWNFIQGSYEFVSPTCEDGSGNSIVGTERSDCMQRGYACVETRPSGPGPWDGFGDYSAKAMNNYLAGAQSQFGQIEDRGEIVDFHLPEQGGHPFAEINNGVRTFTRANDDPEKEYKEDGIKLPGQTLVEQDVYLIYGSAHVNMPEVNILYEPIKYKGTLPPVIDPTDPLTFAMLQNLEGEDAPDLYGQARDITLKLIYGDGTVAFQLVPLQSYSRPFSEEPDEILLPQYFGVVVPGNKTLCSVEMYHRDFIITDYEVAGNITDPDQNITAENFMDEATLITTFDYSCNCPGTPDYVEPGTPCDDGNPFTINDVEDGFCNCEGTAIPYCGQVKNPSFTESLARWRYWGIEGESTNEEAAITILDINDAGFGYEPLEVITNERYTLKFDAYALEDRTIDVFLTGEFDFENGQDGTEFFNATFEITTTKTEYEITFTAPENEDKAFVEFNFSNNDVTLFIDNVCFDIACSLTEIPYNGIDDDCDLSTLDDDIDQDGFALANDCDDNNPNINPGQTEVPYDGIDNDCNPLTLDDDLDQDGYDSSYDCDDNNPNVSPGQTEIPYNGIDDDCYSFTLDDDLDQDGFVLAEDCDDNNALINSAQAEIPYNGRDDDCNSATLDDDLDQDGFVLAEDCDDNNANINADATDIPDNGIDEDCDGIDETNIVDNDNDGFNNDVDCDDTNANINPDQAEIPYNGLDDDCDAMTLDDDLDQDGFVLSEDCDDTNAQINSAQAETPYNTIDDDCNPATLDDDLDQDGFVLADDCDDNNVLINTAQTEIPYNGLDDDCNASTLDDDLDQDGFDLAEDCDDFNASINPDLAEIPYNGQDDDCNPSTLDDDLDQDGFVLEDDCDDDNPEINTDAEEFPNNDIDEDCDGMDLLTSTQAISDLTMKVYPNPAADIINIEVSGQINYEVNLYTLEGKCIKSESNTKQMALGTFAPGIYILEIVNSETNQKTIDRIIITR